MEVIKEFRPCGECSECCKGQLLGHSYGNPFGKGKKCIFLVKENCSIYESRPETCRKYQCAWSQGILDIDMRPDIVGLMVSVENDKTGKQFLRSMETRPDNISYESYKKIENSAVKLQTYLKKVKYNNEHNIYNQRWGRSCDNCNSCT